MSYELFSNFYDKLTADVDYKNRTDYLIALFKKYGHMPTLLLDVGCGTGNFSLEFARRGIDVIAVDPSSEMLSVATDKAKRENLSVLFLNQSGEDMDLYGTVDGAICCLDTVNHITDKRTLQRFFNRISLFLEAGKLFIFDVNTEYKHKNVLADNSFVFENDKCLCVWQNFYDKKSKITDITLDFFVEHNGAYERSSECFSERVYDNNTLTLMLEKAGFQLVKIFEENTFKKPQINSQRIVFVVRKGS